MKRRILLILLAACLGLAACQGQVSPAAGTPTEPTPGESRKPAEPGAESTAEGTEQPSEPAESLPAIPAEEAQGFTALDSGLIAWLQANGLERESFTVSPLSVKAALALTALGAEGETQKQILSVLGFANPEELKAWYATVLAGAADFESRITGADKAQCAYRVVNALFHNAACDGEFRESYRELAASVLAARAESWPAEELTRAINAWVSDQTDGMIPSIVTDASKSASVLVNALYLKTLWTEPFQAAPERSSFTTVDGETVQKEFIQKTDKFRYYDDGQTQLVVLPLLGDTELVLVLGEGGDLSGKLAAAQTCKVHVTLPKFEVETGLENKELVRYLRSVGCTQMFIDGGAEFDPMFTEGVYVDDIIHKAKVSVDENGLEAAAATAVIMMRNTALPKPEQPVEFLADRPFRFLIVREDAAPELLFWGQIMD